MVIAIFVFAVLAIITTGNITFSNGTVININWCALIDLILLIIYFLTD